MTTNPVIFDLQALLDDSHRKHLANGDNHEYHKLSSDDKPIRHAIGLYNALENNAHDMIIWSSMPEQYRGIITVKLGSIGISPDILLMRPDEGHYNGVTDVHVKQMYYNHFVTKYLANKKTSLLCVFDNCQRTQEWLKLVGIPTVGTVQ